jgi:hypothetical protein
VHPEWETPYQAASGELGISTLALRCAFSYQRPPQMRRLTKAEISFLRWLRDQGGNCALPENNEFGSYYRLVKTGYVEMQLPDRFIPAVVNFKLTESGQGVLEAAEGQQSVANTRTHPNRTSGLP